MNRSVHPVTPDRWRDLETLFQEASATRNCWCMWWRIAGNTWRDTTRASRKSDFARLVEMGPPPGLLAYDGKTPAGWVQITPRTDIPRFNAARTGKPANGADLATTWALSCFYIARAFRGQGLMAELARAACDWAQQHGASCVEAAALNHDKPLQWSDGYTGLINPLASAGFAQVEQRGTRRSLMRWTAP